jgi:hypothetical protein
LVGRAVFTPLHRPGTDLSTKNSNVLVIRVSKWTEARDPSLVKIRATRSLPREARRSAGKKLPLKFECCKHQPKSRLICRKRHLLSPDACFGNAK